MATERANLQLRPEYVSGHTCRSTVLLRSGGMSRREQLQVAILTRIYPVIREDYLGSVKLEHVRVVGGGCIQGGRL